MLEEKRIESVSSDARCPWWQNCVVRSHTVKLYIIRRGIHRVSKRSVKMLCLDMKLVSRLRGNSSGTNTSPTHPTQPSTVLPSSSSTERNKSRKARRESGEVKITTSDSEEELLRPGSSIQEMIRRNRSRSVCVATILPSSQLRQLHRRASHVYVASDLTRLTTQSIVESSNVIDSSIEDYSLFFVKAWASSSLLSLIFFISCKLFIPFLLLLLRKTHENLLFCLILDLLIDLSLFFFHAITLKLCRLEWMNDLTRSAVAEKDHDPSEFRILNDNRSLFLSV